jgi:hypothetical protein
MSDDGPRSLDMNMVIAYPALFDLTMALGYVYFAIACEREGMTAADFLDDDGDPK